MDSRKVIQTKTLYRFLKVERDDAIDAEKRTARVAFSSEEPYERFFGTEILDHGPSSPRLGRLKDGGPLLLDHDTTRHVGVVEGVDIGSDRIGRAIVRFGKGAEADAAWQDVVDGIRRHVSVGYQIHRMVLESETEDRATYRVTDWEPIEISLVAVPADPTVGVGRSAEASVPTEVFNFTIKAPDASAFRAKPKETVRMSDKNEKPADAPSGEQAEKLRVERLCAIADKYEKHGARALLSDAIRTGKSPDQFAEAIMDGIQARHTDTSALHIGMTRQEVQRYSLGRALQAALNGDWSKAGFERECSEAVTRMLGKSPEGFYVPYDTFRRDFNVGTTTEAGNLVPTDLRGDLYVDALRAAIVMAGLGIRVLPGLSANLDIPRKATPSTLGMLTEIGSAAETNPLTAKLTLSPKRIGAYVEVSKQALIQSAIPLEGMIRDDLLMSAAVLLENQMINGNGTSPNILGIRNTTTISTVAGGTNGAAVVWSHFVDLESAVANANAEPDRLAGYLTNTRVRGKSKQVQKGTNLPFIWDNGAFPLNGYRAAVTNNVPSNLTKGTSTTVCSASIFASDWSMAVLGLFGAPDITVDPYTKADTGQVKITLNQFADFGIRQPGAFAVILDQLTT